LGEVLGRLLNRNGNLNNHSMNRQYDYINNYEESLAKKVNIIVHDCMPQLLTNIKTQQRIDDYGSFNDIMSLTISRHSEMIGIELRVNIPVGVAVGLVVGNSVGTAVG
jgi:hypothetical protein